MHAKTLLKNNLPNIVKAALGTTIGAGAGAGIEAAIKGAGDHVTQIVKEKATNMMNNARNRMQHAVDAGRQDMRRYAGTVEDNTQPHLAQVLANPMARTQMITDGAALIANHHPSIMEKTVGDALLGSDIASRSPFISGGGTGIAGPTDLQMRRQLIADRMQKAVGDGFFDDLWDGIKGVGKSVVHGVEGLVEHPGKTLEGLATLPLQMIPGGSGLSKALGGGGPSTAQAKPSTNVYVIKEGGQKPVGDARLGLTPRNTVGKTAFNQAPSTLIQPSRALGMLPRGSMAQETPAMRNQNALAISNRKRSFAQMDAPGSEVIAPQMVMGMPIGSDASASVGTESGSGVDKVAGDAAPPAAAANTFKTVGDALPPNDATTSDERNMAMMTHGEIERAGGMVANSIIGRLLALLVQKEQLLDCQSYFSTGLNSTQMRGVTIQNYEQKDAIWNLTSIRFNASLPFMAFQPTAFPLEADNTHTDLQYALSAVSVVEIELEQPTISPPLASNVTYAALAPLLDGMPITEFASALRIRIRNTDVDALVNLAALTKLNFEAQTGYSFMSMLLKMMAYQSWFFYLPGNEWDQIATGVNYDVDGGNWDLQDVMFPFDLKQANNRYLTRALYAGRNLQVAVITYREYTDKLLGRQNDGARWTVMGQNRNWAPEFEPDQWTTNCAVVFINSSEKANYPERLSARMLSQMAYPVTFRRSNTAWRSFQAVDNDSPEWVDVAGAAEGHIYCNGNLMHIPGPTDTVLFVMTDLEDIKQGFQLTLGATGHTVNVTWLMTPGNPGGAAILTGAINNYLDNADVPTVLQWEIARWESRYGNASDRSSAMRVLANALYRKGPGRYYSESTVAAQRVQMGYRQVIIKTGGQAPAPANFPIDNVVFDYDDNVQDAPPIFNNIKYGTELPIGYKMVGRNQDDAHTLWIVKTQGTTFKIGQTDAIMQLMAERGWLKPSEESPQTNLSNPARTFASIREMAEIIHAITTHLREANSLSLFDFFGYGQTNVVNAREGQIDSNLAMRMKFFGPAQDVMTYGIQYPQATVLFEQMKPDNGAGLMDVNDWDLNRLLVTPWVGESHIALSKYLGAPILAETRARFNSPTTYKATKMQDPDNPNRRIIVDSIVPGYDDVDEVKALYGLRIWTKAALPVGEITNPKFILDNITTGQVERMYVAFDSPLVDGATLTSYGEHDYANLFTTFPLPIIHNVVVYIWAIAGERIRYGVPGLRSSFVIPEGTPSSALFVTLNDTVSTEVSPYWSGNGQPHLFRAKTLAEFL
mgnify:FL=1